MIKKRIFTVILSVLLVICCVTEAFFIKSLQSDNAELKEQVQSLQNAVDDQSKQMQNMSESLMEKADKPLLRIYLPDDIYVCESQGTDIYNSSVVYGINLNSYAFYWDAPIGNSRNDRFEIPAKSVPGDYEVTFRIYDLQLNELASKTTMLHVVRDASGTERDSAILDMVSPVVFCENDEELPDKIKQISVMHGKNNETENDPNVVFVFPSAYETYSDLDATMEQITTLVPKIKSQYGDIPVLIVEPSYPGSNVEEEAVPDENGAFVQRWAYAEKTMVFRLASDLEKTYIDDDDIWIVPNALMTKAENSPEKVESAICGILCHLIQEQRIKTDE